MKIAIYHNHYSKSSGEDVMFNLHCESLQELGHEVLPVQVQVNDVLKKNSKIELAKMGFRAAANPHSLILANRKIDEFQPDIAHVHNWFPIFSPTIYKAHFQRNIPVVQTLHNYRLGCATGNFQYKGEECEDCLIKGRTQALKKKCYQNSCVGSYFWKRTIDRNFKNGIFTHPMLHYVCPSSEVLNRHLKIGIPSEKMTVIPNACKDPIKGEKSPDRKQFRVIFLGRLVKEKGVDVLINAWREVEENTRNHHLKPELSIIGEGLDSEELRQLATDLKTVCFHGYLSHEEAYEILRKSSVIVFPSVWREPFGLGIIEGMAAKCAVIASDIGGPAELVEHGKNGLLFRTGDSVDLAEKLIRLIVDPVQTEKLGEKGREDFLGKYQPQAHATQLGKLYSSILL